MMRNVILSDIVASEEYGKDIIGTYALCAQGTHQSFRQRTENPLF